MRTPRLSLPVALLVLVLAALADAAAAQNSIPAASAQPQSSAALRIVVIEGEDSINIIQQRTAVAPVVEVRDRNDQPVGGATVTFAIRAGRATFSGARTLTVTTNAAGRAVAAGLTPTGSGAVQIGASAAFQGQTAAATIVQTNVMTAAQAAGAGASGVSAGGAGAGSSAGAGGAVGGAAGGAAGGVAAGAAAAGAAGAAGAGISATTIGVIGAAAAGGAVAVAKVASSGSGDSASAANPANTKTFVGTASMTYLQTATASGLLNLPGNVNGTCTFTVAVALTLKATVGFDGQGTPNGGQMETSWTETLVSQSCSGTTFFNGPWGPFTDGLVGGPRFDGVSRGGSGGTTVTTTYSFAGVLSGDAITGTFTLARTEVNAAVGARNDTPPTSATVTLQRQ